MRRVRGLVALTLGLAVGVAAVRAQIRFRPAQYLDGSLPTVSPLVVGGGQVVLELTVTKDGRVADAKALRSSPPFTAALTAAVQAWQFRPAERLTLLPGASGQQAEQWQKVEAKVLVAEIVRPPTINTPTLGQLPKDIAVPSEESPFPSNIVTPLYPPQARNSGAVLVEVTVGANGSVIQARVVRSPPGVGNLEASALTAARAWSFRPARVGGVLVSTNAYLIFVFRQPVLAGSPEH